MREFKVTPKKVKVTVGEKSVEMLMPNMSHIESLNEDLKAMGADKAIEIYKKFFATLGLDESIIGQMDADDFFDFVNFILNPKKSQ